jgi:lysozyme
LHSDTVLWLDIENEGDWNKQQAVAFTKEFISYVQARGYKIGIFAYPAKKVYANREAPKSFPI